MNPFLLYSVFGCIPVLITDGNTQLIFLGVQVGCLIAGALTEAFFD